MKIGIYLAALLAFIWAGQQAHATYILNGTLSMAVYLAPATIALRECHEQYCWSSSTGPRVPDARPRWTASDLLFEAKAPGALSLNP